MRTPDGFVARNGGDFDVRTAGGFDARNSGGFVANTHTSAASTASSVWISMFFPASMPTMVCLRIPAR